MRLVQRQRERQRLFFLRTASPSSSSKFRIDTSEVVVTSISDQSRDILDYDIRIIISPYIRIVDIRSLVYP